MILAPLLILIGILALHYEVEPANLTILLHLHQFIVTFILFQCVLALMIKPVDDSLYSFSPRLVSCFTPIFSLISGVRYLAASC